MELSHSFFVYNRDLYIKETLEVDIIPWETDVGKRIGRPSVLREFKCMVEKLGQI